MKLFNCAAVLAASSIAVGPALAEAPRTLGLAPPAAGAPQPQAAIPAIPTMATPMAAPAPAPVAIKVPEGTEFPMRLEDTLSSRTAQVGDRFTISLTEDVKLPDGTVLRAGYRGAGEVVVAEKSGMMGKSGKLSIRLDYVKVGEQKIRLRATKGSEGKGNGTNQVVGVIFIGVFAAFIKGHSTEIPKGTQITAYCDQDLMLDTPAAAPPSIS